MMLEVWRWASTVPGFPLASRQKKTR